MIEFLHCPCYTITIGTLSFHMADDDGLKPVKPFN